MGESNLFLPSPQCLGSDPVRCKLRDMNMEATSGFRLVGHWPYLTAHSCNLAFIHAGFCHHICQRASSQVFHDNPQFISYKVTVRVQIKGEKEQNTQSLRLHIHKVNVHFHWLWKSRVLFF